MSENPTGFNSYWPMEGEENNMEQFSDSGFYISNPNLSYQQHQPHQTPVTFFVPNETIGGNNMYSTYTEGTNVNTDFENEPPLLEELGIEPSKIITRSFAVLNPFQSVPFDDVDLVGPVCYCLTLGGLLILMGSKINFGYVYGLAVTSCVMMYILLNLMTNTPAMTLSFVASVLGYSLIPMIFLSFFSLFIPLQTSLVGWILTALAIFWCSFSASQIFVTITNDYNQRLLFVYPCILLYGVFALLVLF